MHKNTRRHVSEDVKLSSVLLMRASACEREEVSEQVGKYRSLNVPIGSRVTDLLWNISYYHEVYEIKSRLISGNACCHSVQNLSSCLKT